MLCQVNEDSLPQRIPQRLRNSTIGPSSRASLPIATTHLHLSIFFTFFCCQHSGIRQCRECCFPFYFFLEVVSEKVKRLPLVLWHINSSQCKEKGSKWFQIQKQTGRSDKAPDYRVLQAQIKRDTF